VGSSGVNFNQIADSICRPGEGRDPSLDTLACAGVTLVRAFVI
jgi:hypothetical protein